MKIALIDTFYDVSHKVWAEGFKNHSKHEVDIFSGSSYHWKWKMTGGTIQLAEQVNLSTKQYDLFLATDMVHLPLFTSLLKESYTNIPVVLYFHENQITYPWSPTDQDIRKNRDHHYGFINYTSALVANRIVYNSEYHKKSFLNALPGFLDQFPDGFSQDQIDQIIAKSTVLPIGLELPEYTPSDQTKPVFVWNHRWEYDKNPDFFFNTLLKLKKEEIDFELIVLGQSYRKSPKIFEEVKEELKNEIVHFGYAKDKASYIRLLQKANILFVTSFQDFFGISIVEAIAAGCFPLMPDRLSYREHINLLNKDVMIYQEDNECLSILKKIISEQLYLKTEATSKFVGKYAWSSLIDSYDNLLENLTIS